MWEMRRDIVQLRLTAAGETELTAVALPHQAGALRPGAEVTLTVDPANVVVLPPD